MSAHLSDAAVMEDVAQAPSLALCPTLSPVLVFGYGNPSRGDDALGPMLLELLGAQRGGGTAPAAFDLLTDFQLQPEHALDLRGRSRVLFVDASTRCAAPCELRRIGPEPDASVFTHALAPGALLAVYQRVEGMPPPPAWLLAIRGHAFELGAPLTPEAREHLAAALRCAQDWLAAD